MIGVLFLWIGLSVAVGIGANTKGRSGGGWFCLALLLSPLIAGIIVLALPNLRAAQGAAALAYAAEPFKPEGILNGIPYRVLASGQIEVMLSGGRAIFRSVEELAAVAQGGAVAPKPPDPAIIAEFPLEMNGYRYKEIRKGHSYAVLTPAGERVQYDWQTLWSKANLTS